VGGLRKATKIFGRNQGVPKSITASQNFSTVLLLLLLLLSLLLLLLLLLLVGASFVIGHCVVKAAL
jgi:hypothetical protein